MSDARQDRRALVRAPQDVLGGAAVLALAAGALLVLSRITSGGYATVSPTLFPRLCAYGLVAGGLVLFGRGFLRDGPGLDAPALRPTVLVCLAVVLFGIVTPAFGYAPASLLTVLVGGLAAPELRLRHLLGLSIGLTIFSVLLFSYVLKLTIPILLLPGFRF
jgi:hypothetical protein